MLSFVLRRFLFIFLLAAFYLVQGTATAKERGAFIFIPLDNRPVCFSYPVRVMEAAGYKIYVPPEKFLASRTLPADTLVLAGKPRGKSRCGNHLYGCPSLRGPRCFPHTLFRSRCTGKKDQTPA